MRKFSRYLFLYCFTDLSNIRPREDWRYFNNVTWYPSTSYILVTNWYSFWNIDELREVTSFVDEVFRSVIGWLKKHFTVIGARMSQWKWRETKLQPNRARPGHQISCCLVSLNFLRDILAPITVQRCTSPRLWYFVDSFFGGNLSTWWADCSYLLDKQALGTHKEKHYKIWQTRWCATL